MISGKSAQISFRSYRLHRLACILRTTHKIEPKNHNENVPGVLQRTPTDDALTSLRQKKY